MEEADTGLGSQSTDDETGQPTAGNGDAYVPYQPALDAGISPEMDRLNARRIALAERKSRGELSPEEQAEFARLQAAFFGYLETILPRSSILDDDRIEKLEQKYAKSK